MCPVPPVECQLGQKRGRGVPKRARRPPWATNLAKTMVGGARCQISPGGVSPSNSPNMFLRVRKQFECMQFSKTASRGAKTCPAPPLGNQLGQKHGRGCQICTDERYARAHAPGFGATAAPSYSSGPGPCPDDRVSAQLGTVTQLPVHPASPVLLTKNGPLGALDSVARLNKAATSSYLFNSDERFACQYRCGPPPEFPLASPRSGIVHHLSGPDRYSLTRTLHKRSGSVDGVTHKGIPPISFLARYGFTRPLTRTHGRLLGPCPERAARAWATITIRIGQCPEPIGGPAPTVPHPTETHRFSLGRNLPPDWGCIPKQPDSPTAPCGATRSGHDEALTLSGAPFQGSWARSTIEDASPDYNSDAKGD
ncbi:hypothetical protein Fmac_033026 [Flemingia macrophylla]|uniref:Uncharacterized protein n=1 Tax=Flemingia macrophylla TaxID=520843 RepID=A0ABD1L6K9_9FABA